MYLRFGLSCMILIIYFVCTTFAKNNGPRSVLPRRHFRRAAQLSEFLTPPAFPARPRNRVRPPNSFFRQGKSQGLTPPPPPPPPPLPTQQSSGFFSSFMGWLNPFSEVPPASVVTPPRPPVHQNSNNLQIGQLQPPRLAASYSPPLSSTAVHGSPSQMPSQVPHAAQYQPPCAHGAGNGQLPQPPSPAAGQAYLPPVGGGCQTCNSVPWVPMNHQQSQSASTRGPNLSTQGIYQIPIPSQEIKPPDFGHEPPRNLNPQQINIPSENFPSPMTGPLPYPHLYPGAIPPLFKAQPFDSQSANSGQNVQSLPAEGVQLAGDTSRNQNPANTQENSQEGYVDVLPPGAEVVSAENPSTGVVQDSGSSSSDLKQVLHTSVEHETSLASPSPIVHLQSSSVDSQHVIHIEESPLIDFSNEKVPLAVPEDAPVLLQNLDGTYGINVTWPNNLNPTAEVNTNLRREITTSKSVSNQDKSTPGSLDVTSLLVDVLDSTRNLSDIQRLLGQEPRPTHQPYGTYSEVLDDITVQEPFKDISFKSHESFKQENTEAEGSKISTDLRLSSDYTALQQDTSDETSLEYVNKPVDAKRSKKVQIIIPYTSQYTPSKFHPSRDLWSVENVSKSMARKIPDSQKGNFQEFPPLIQALTELSKSVKPPIISGTSSVKANTSIDVLRLQKNIDNWTIQEYSEGTTELPSPPRPYLQQSKKIPKEYLTTTEPLMISAETIKEAEETFGHVLAGFSVNDLEHEGSASSQIQHVRVTSQEEDSEVTVAEIESTTSTNSVESSSEESSWEQLPVSISPLSKERVYVVTPQSASKPTTFQTNLKEEKKSATIVTTNATSQFESIEKAYQVLPQAVNNLAVVSTGPATVPLWGIMEHEDYASKSTLSISLSEKPILYAGHSKVSHTRQ